jgi:hypothetical protein
MSSAIIRAAKLYSMMQSCASVAKLRAASPFWWNPIVEFERGVLLALLQIEITDRER